MLGRFPADQGAARLYAALGHTGNQRGDLFRLVLPDGDIVQKEQRPGTAADDVVDAHGNAVDADRVVLSHQLSDALLGSDPVGSGHQNRLFHAGGVRLKQTAEAADVRENARNQGPPDMLLHPLYALIAGLDVDAGGGVGFRM